MENEDLSPEERRHLALRQAEGELERRQLTIREDELRLRERELDLNTQFANRSLDAQERDRGRFWDWMADQAKRGERISIVVIAGALVFVAMALYADHPELVEKILYAIFGGLGGYGIGRTSKKTDPPAGESPPQ
jgi:hypothetical protein